MCALCVLCVCALCGCLLIAVSALHAVHEREPLHTCPRAGLGARLLPRRSVDSWTNGTVRRAAQDRGSAGNLDDLAGACVRRAVLCASQQLCLCARVRACPFGLLLLRLELMVVTARTLCILIVGDSTDMVVTARTLCILIVAAAAAAAAAALGGFWR